MALLCFNCLPSLSSSRLQPSAFVSPASRLHIGLNSITNQPVKSWSGVSVHTPFISAPGKAASTVIVRAASVVDGTGSDNNKEEEKAVVPVDQLPLESREQQKIEQKMRMKLAKKIRLRRKRLVRKRKMRKKGRWPPSKMKKLKNV